MKRKPRIAMIGTRGIPTTYGGVERAVQEQSSRLVASGFDVTVYCRNGYVDERLPTWEGVTLRHLPCIGTKHLEAITHTVLATLDASVRNFDIVHFHATGPALCAPIARLARKRVVVTVQGLDFKRRKWGWIARGVLRMGAWIAAHVANRTVVVSKELQTYFSEHYGCNAVYLPNGVSAPHRGQVAPFGLLSSGYFLFLGRLVPEKRVTDLIAAFSTVQTDLQLVIAGPSSHSDDYVAEINRVARRDPRVLVLGPIYGETKDALMENAYAFCQPSELEGLPITLLEAMALGVCPIVSDIAPHLQLIGSSNSAVAGLAFATGDVTSLACVLREAIAAPQLIATTGVAAQAVAEHFDWKEITPRLAAVYDDLLPNDRAALPFGRV